MVLEITLCHVFSVFRISPTLDYFSGDPDSLSQDWRPTCGCRVKCAITPQKLFVASKMFVFNLPPNAQSTSLGRRPICIYVAINYIPYKSDVEI